MTDKLFSALLKYWRGKRGMSQLDLALAADVSARHISFLESGRAKASEEMILRLMSPLGISLRDQNEVLRAAGFSEKFPETSLETLPPAIDLALTRMLKQQEPFPLTVMNSSYDILRSNQAASEIFSHFIHEPSQLKTPVNLYALVFDPKLARSFISNWLELAQYMVSRLHRESLERPNDQGLQQLLEQLFTYPDIPKTWRQPDFSTNPAATLSIILERGPLRLQFFTVVTAFSAPQQITLEELRIESYFPLDEATQIACEEMAQGKNFFIN